MKSRGSGGLQLKAEKCQINKQPRYKISGIAQTQFSFEALIRYRTREWGIERKTHAKHELRNASFRKVEIENTKMFWHFSCLSIVCSDFIVFRMFFIVFFSISQYFQCCL